MDRLEDFIDEGFGLIRTRPGNFISVNHQLQIKRALDRSQQQEDTDNQQSCYDSKQDSANVPTNVREKHVSALTCSDSNIVISCRRKGLRLTRLITLECAVDRGLRLAADPQNFERDQFAFVDVGSNSIRIEGYYVIRVSRRMLKRSFPQP